MNLSRLFQKGSNLGRPSLDRCMQSNGLRKWARAVDSLVGQASNPTRALARCSSNLPFFCPLARLFNSVALR